MNLGEIRERAERRFRDTGGLIVGTNTWNQHINQAMREFLRAGRWPFTVTSETISVSPNTRLVDLDAVMTADAAEVISSIENVYDLTNDRIVQPMPYYALSPQEPWRFRLYIESQDPGEPALFSVVGKDLFLVPPPREAVSLRVYWFQDPTDLEDDTDEPVVPARYQEALVSGAVAKAHLDDQNREAAAEYVAEFQGIVTQAMGELILGRTEQIQRMNVDAEATSMQDLGLSADKR